MSVYFTDSQIASLIQVPKGLPRDFASKLTMKPKLGHKEQELDVESNGMQYRIMLRQSMRNALDFSVVLACLDPKTNRLFRLRRYNGKSHLHSNTIEMQTEFYDFHIHQATERYQELGRREDAYATISDRFSDIRGAIDCLIQDCNFIPPAGQTISLFA